MGLQDGVQVVHALLVLNFGDDLHVVPAAVVEDSPDGLHIRRPADEGGGDKVKVVFHAKADVVDILLGEGGQLDMDAGDVDGLVGRQGAAVLHGTDNICPLDALHPDGHQAVVNENLLAGLELLMELGVGDRHPALIARHVLGGEGEGVAGFQGNGLGLEASDANFGALGVQNGGHRPAHGVPDGFEHVQPGQVLRVAAVGKVEPGRVHAGADQGADHVLTVHRGAQGADNFCSSHVVTSFGYLVFIRCLRNLCYRKKPGLDRAEFHKNVSGPAKKVCCPSNKDSTF